MEPASSFYTFLLLTGGPSASFRCLKTSFFSLSFLWVFRTGSASDWCALREALYKLIDTIQYNTIQYAGRSSFVFRQFSLSLSPCCSTCLFPQTFSSVYACRSCFVFRQFSLSLSPCCSSWLFPHTSPLNRCVGLPLYFVNSLCLCLPAIQPVF